MKRQKYRTPNERFGASGVVSRPTVCGDFGSLSPVRAAVKPPPSPSRLDVRRQRATARRTRKRKLTKIDN
jgi:hypothetical protein